MLSGQNPICTSLSRNNASVLSFLPVKFHLIKLWRASDIKVDKARDIYRTKARCIAHTHEKKNFSSMTRLCSQVAMCTASQTNWTKDHVTAWRRMLLFFFFCPPPQALLINMEEQDEQDTDIVCGFPDLWDKLRKDFKDVKMFANAWYEIVIELESWMVSQIFWLVL